MQKYLPININNVIGWLKLIRDVYNFSKEDYRKIDSFIKRKDVIRRWKQLDNIFEGESI